MDLKNKLKGLPPVYYVNLDNRTDRREYMETQFDYWGIKDYHRVSASKYLASKIDEWLPLISNKKEYQINPPYTANFITHLEMIKNWLETTNELYMIMMEDDYDLSLIEYWNFDWEYLMNHIPYDWDCIQLGFESFTYIHFFLHPKTPKTYFGACLINRNYAKKLIRLYLKDGKFIIDNEINDDKHLETNIANGTVDFSICNNGKVYCIPLIPQNPYYTSHENYNDRKNDFLEHMFNSYNLYYKWWKEEHHKFPLEDFFRYNKPNDWEMTKDVKLEKLKKQLNYS
jgi:hypothetical protein